ncbi:MAG: hypothetical protein ABNH21_06675 [Glaciecola sp.]|jgi:hypothetical protein
MSFRRAAKKDANHVEIVRAFRTLGFSVLDVAQLKNCCDIFAAKNGKTYAIEIKDGKKPPSARKLSDGEQSFMESWRGEWRLVESIEDVIKLDEQI